MTAKSNINAEWHKKHPMPKNPTLDQRVKWHSEHLKNCACRTEFPPKLKIEMKKKGIRIPV